MSIIPPSRDCKNVDLCVSYVSYSHQNSLIRNTCYVFQVIRSIIRSYAGWFVQIRKRKKKICKIQRADKKGGGNAGCKTRLHWVFWSLLYVIVGSISSGKGDCSKWDHQNMAIHFLVWIHYYSCHSPLMQRIFLELKLSFPMRSSILATKFIFWTTKMK